jgi:hypothetical protein
VEPTVSYKQCPNCHSVQRKWKDDSNDRDNPENLFCIQERVHLVSSVYLCERNHQIVSHDPRIINEVRKQIQIPVVLFHKSGVSKDLFDYIIVNRMDGLETHLNNNITHYLC